MKNYESLEGALTRACELEKMGEFADAKILRAQSKGLKMKNYIWDYRTFSGATVTVMRVIRAVDFMHACTILHALAAPEDLSYITSLYEVQEK